MATLAFVAYSRTLLPGVDLGDTGSFQASVLWTEVNARRAYPLYFGLAAPFVGAISPGNPARGLNLFSALWAAVAVGLLSWTVSTVARSLAAGAVAGLLLAFSYTFWTQAVIAEVYTLHLALIGASLVALHAYSQRPTVTRFAIACLVYAVGFGNHLSTILLLPPFAAFVLLSHPRPREIFRARAVLPAVGVVLLASLLYLPSLIAALTSIEAPASMAARLATFWFEVTKADWRDTMLLGAAPGGDRLAMWSWDAQQQFGLTGVVVAATGALRLWWISRPWAVLVAGAYACCTAFALTYNVGDAHVFFLPGHFFTAFAAGAAFAPPIARDAREDGRAWLYSRAAAAASVTMLAYAGWRGLDTWPAADRHLDARGATLTTRLTAGISERDALLVSGLNWEVENALLYAGRTDRNDVVWLRANEVMPYLPFLIRDNHSIGRDIVLTDGAAAAVVAAYGDAFPVVPDDIPIVQSLEDVAAAIPAGTPYVLTRLAPVSQYRYDAVDVDAALRILTGTPRPAGTARYEVVAGLAGQTPSYTRDSARPFRETFQVGEETLTVRMDGWLPTDTFRRGGFGHVIHDGRTVLVVERGVSLQTLRPGSEPTYAAGPYAPQRRYRIPAGGTRLAKGVTDPSGSATVPFGGGLARSRTGEDAQRAWPLTNAR